MAAVYDMSKYGNIKTHRIINGEKVTFDSKKEGKRYDELYLLLKQGKIQELTLQPKYLLIDTLRMEGHKTMPKRYYVADFRYIKNHITIVEDVKGMKTPMYNLKKHMFLLKYGHELIFKEVF